jgi:hypothetical protein
MNRVTVTGACRWLFGPALLGAFIADAFAGEQTWRFSVWLDDRKIGYHEFVLREQGAQWQLQSEASFEYKLLFVKLYGYQHENLETWEDGCLSRIESRTDANGTDYQVRGMRQDGRFVLEGAMGEQVLPACVMTFAYWNPDFLQADRLLNSQNGELVEVSVSPPQPDTLSVRGSEQPAIRYRLQAGKRDILLWYSEDRQWLALETEARGGRRLRYELF